MRSRLIRIPELEEVLGITRVTIRSLRKRGEFPKPVRISKRSLGWREEDIDAWVRERTQEPMSEEA